MTVDLRWFGGTADFYFIRHGESEANRDGVIQGRAPSRLTDTGAEQARQAGEWFRPGALDHGPQLPAPAGLRDRAQSSRR